MVTAALVPAVASCRPGTSRIRGAVDGNADTVIVTRVSPNPVTVHDGRPNQIRIEGRGFHATSNTVLVGPVTIPVVASRDMGRTLTVTLPDRVPSGGGAAPMLWTPGSYPVTVATPASISASVMLTIARP